MDFQHTTVQDLILNDSFQQWVYFQDPQAAAFWEEWLLENPGKKEMLQEARKILFSIRIKEDKPSALEFEEDWARIQATLAAQKGVVSQTRQKTPYLLYRPQVLRWAAVVSFLLLLFGAYSVFKPAPVRSYATRFGEVMEVRLADGSTVTLNSNSTLTLSDFDPEKDREVWLEGEAYFHVTHTENHNRFTVHASDKVAVEVLGTEFNVNTSGEMTRVLLDAGKVKLNLKTASAEQTVHMEPGELVELQGTERIARIVRQKDVDPVLHNSWKENRWVFDKTSLAEVARRIETKYGVQVAFSSESLKEKKISGEIPTTSITRVLEILSTTFGITFTQQKDQIIISEN
jgi:transmembrane sensor